MKFYADILVIVALIFCLAGLIAQFTLFFQASLTSLIIAIILRWLGESDE